MPSILGKFGITLAAAVGIYAVLLGALLPEDIQRFALYANRVNTLGFHDVNHPEDFGFARHQVTPFNISTPDGETLYAWHVLPVDVYARHEQALREENRKTVPLSGDEFELTMAFKLLAEDPRARVVINCSSKVHGNAGHIAQNMRPGTYRQATTLPNTHIIAVDYRGFGHSTGHPTEAGLITDGVALVNWVLHTAKIPPERIVIMGQSLGTAVAAAVGLQFVDPDNSLYPEIQAKTSSSQIIKSSDGITPTLFAGIILVAPFTSVPNMLLTYRMGGWLPLLLPFRPFPKLAAALTFIMVDKWPTAGRLAAYHTACTRAIAGAGSNPSVVNAEGHGRGYLQIIHALNDRDISWRQTEMICVRMHQSEGADTASGECETLASGGVVSWAESGRSEVRIETVGAGGHNKVMTFAPVAAALYRAFGDV